MHIGVQPNLRYHHSEINIKIELPSWFLMSRRLACNCRSVRVPDCLHGRLSFKPSENKRRVNRRKSGALADSGSTSSAAIVPDFEKNNAGNLVITLDDDDDDVT